MIHELHGNRYVACLKYKQLQFIHSNSMGTIAITISDQISVI